MNNGIQGFNFEEVLGFQMIFVILVSLGVW